MANRIEGTRVALDTLRDTLGGDDGLRAHLFGRRPTDAERKILAGTPDSLALLVASPAFQRY